MGASLAFSRPKSYFAELHAVGERSTVRVKSVRLVNSDPNNAKNAPAYFGYYAWNLDVLSMQSAIRRR